MRSIGAADLEVQQQVRSAPVDGGKKTFGNNAKTSGPNAENVGAAAVSGPSQPQPKIPSAYERTRSKRILEQEMDKLLKVIMPDLGIKFRVHDSGYVITTVTNNETQEVVREFPAEKILDLVYDMVQRLGIVTNKKV